VIAKRIFVFGLDGATWKIIDSFIKKGHLPFIKKLISQGARKELISTIPPRTAPAWSSFITGQNPGEHGVFDFVVRNNVFGKEKKKLVNGSWLKTKFWQAWEKDGKRIALINLPMTYPIEEVNGVVVSSILTPRGKKWFYPQELGKVLKEVGYEMENFGFLERASKSKISSREIFAKIKKMAEAKFLLARRLLEKKDWDFFFLLFSETDWIQHLFWRGGQTLKIYQKIDQYLETLYEILRKKYGARNFSFFVISDHGFHLAPGVHFNVYPWLRKNKFLRPSPRAFLGRVLRKFSFWEEDKTKSRFGDWGQSSILKTGSFGFWLNKKVLGKKYNSFRNNLIKELGNLKFENGKKIFRMVAKREDVYWGRKLKDFWDIIWLTNSYFTIGPCSIERKLFVPREKGVKATHDSDRKGIFLVKGVGIKSQLRRWLDRELYIWNMADIFNQIFNYDGKIISGQTGAKRSKFDKAGEKEIIARLKALGYV